MDFKIVCATWINEEDEKILKVLQASDKWLSVAELSEITGLPPRKVERTLRLLKRQMDYSENRKKLLSEE